MMLEQLHIVIVDEEPIAMPTCNLVDDVKRLQLLHHGRNRAVGAAQVLLDAVYREHRILVHEIQHPDSIDGAGNLLTEQLAMLLTEQQYFASRIRCRKADFVHATQEELQPTFPITVVANRSQAVIILRAMSFEVIAQKVLRDDVVEGVAISILHHFLK